MISISLKLSDTTHSDSFMIRASTFYQALESVGRQETVFASFQT